MPDPIIKKPFEYFNVVTYTGTGSTQSITGVGFKPDFVWIKGRGNAENHALFDAVRGANKNLASNTTGTEGTQTDMLMSFDTDGFTLGADGNWQVNKASTAYVAWCWKASNATGVTNTAGSITSTVSANTTSGFSVVTYTGNGSNATVGHGLGVAPSMILHKVRTVGTGWAVWHGSYPTPTTQLLELNTTGALLASSTYWNSSLPTSTTIPLGTYGGVNTNGGTHVAYCFSDVQGYQKAGSYVGNGSTDGPFIFTGFRPKFVLIKSTSGDNWTIVDTSRNPSNVADARLFPSSSSAEATGTANCDMLSNGFKVRIGSTDTGANGNGTTYIYLAIAETPTKFALAR